MQLPLSIYFQHAERSAEVEAAIRDRAAKLERFADDIVSCRVTVEGPHKHSRNAGSFAVRIDLRFSGGEVVASRHPSERVEHADVLVAVRDAFDATRRQLQDRMRKRDGRVKTHADEL